MKPASKAMALAIASAFVLSAHFTLAGSDVKTSLDKMFDFKKVQSWSWSPEKGRIIMARTQEDDPDVARAKAEPIILDAVKTEMMNRGMTASTGASDISLTYYLLLSTTASTQSLGDFLPATTMWGLPPFAPATQSMKVMNKGSLVLDAAANDMVVWRGLAEAKIKMDIDDKQREALLREAVRDLVKEFPAKK
ncbi:MAG TPA: DUF4136 domain-containing protein [Vicinamibacterales bacterium]|nr:DUF4136 domain-containing protein [Vicinamibacterales bacterium]